MENLNEKKFQKLSSTEMNKIQGGKWAVECRTFSDGSTWHCAYRIRSNGNTEWGTPVVDVQ